MGQPIDTHASVMNLFLTKLKADQNIHVCDYKVGGYETYILNILKLKGTEDRPFTDDEIRKVLFHYRYFRDYFTKLGLWLPLE